MPGCVYERSQQSERRRTVRRRTRGTALRDLATKFRAPEPRGGAEGKVGDTPLGRIIADLLKRAGRDGFPDPRRVRAGWLAAACAVAVLGAGGCPAYVRFDWNLLRGKAAKEKGFGEVTLGVVPPLPRG